MWAEWMDFREWVEWPVLAVTSGLSPCHTPCCYFAAPMQSVAYTVTDAEDAPRQRKRHLPRTTHRTTCPCAHKPGGNSHCPSYKLHLYLTCHQEANLAQLARLEAPTGSTYSSRLSDGASWGCWVPVARRRASATQGDCGPERAVVLSGCTLAL